MRAQSPYHVGRSTADSSTRVVYAALAGNLAIATAKFVAYVISGASAMLTEAIHSLVDSIDQILLLIGESLGAGVAAASGARQRERIAASSIAIAAPCAI